MSYATVLDKAGRIERIKTAIASLEIALRVITEGEPEGPHGDYRLLPGLQDPLEDLIMSYLLSIELDKARYALQEAAWGLRGEVLITPDAGA